MKIRLLIVDDEDDIRQMLDRHFRYIGYETDTACNGREALEKLSEDKFDIVISDIKMPEMDGIELLRGIRDQHPMVRTIMVTGYVTLENALSCMRLGAETCIFKPLEDLEELVNAVKRSVDYIKHWQDKFVKLQAMR